MRQQRLDQNRSIRTDSRIKKRKTRRAFRVTKIKIKTLEEKQQHAYFSRCYLGHLSVSLLSRFSQRKGIDKKGGNRIKKS